MCAQSQPKIIISNTTTEVAFSSCTTISAVIRRCRSRVNCLAFLSNGTAYSRQSGMVIVLPNDQRQWRYWNRRHRTLAHLNGLEEAFIGTEPQTPTASAIHWSTGSYPVSPMKYCALHRNPAGLYRRIAHHHEVYRLWAIEGERRDRR